MLNIMLTDLVPIFVIMILGYVSGKKGEFNAANARSLNQFVLNYALPAGLFVSIVKADRAMLFSDIRLSLVSLGVIVGCYFWSYFSCLKFFKHSKAEASIAGLVGGAPTIGYLGFAVLEPIYGTSATVGLVVAVVAIVVNAVTIPLALCLLNPGRQSAAAAGNPPVKPSNVLLNALKEPVCWSPILAVLIVLTGFRFPGSLDPVFNLIANANAGVAVFAAGITLSTNKFEFNAEVLYNSFVKLIFMPAAMLAIGLLTGMNGEKLQMLVLCGALPPVFSGIIIGSRFQTYVQTGTSSLAVSTFLFMATAPLWIWLSRLIAG
ncbi:MAG: transporter YfdV [Alphaproteobacteria bacterium]